jgi:hypothetical protein
MLVRERPATAIRYEPGMILPGLVEHPAFESKDPFLGGEWPAYAMLDGVPIHEGDWIVTRPNGSRRVVTPEQLEREYEQAA